MNIRKASAQDLSRIAEILVFVKRMKFRPIFQNDAYSFGELQVLPVAEKYAAPDILNHIWVYDDGVVKGLIHIEGGPGHWRGPDRICEKRISRGIPVGH